MGNLLQIVDDISASPSVLLNLNNDSPWSAAAIQAPPPPIRRSVTSSMLADGDTISSSSYGNRQITLTLDLIQSSQDNWAASFQTLARNIDQEQFWIKYQPTGMTSPVFFRCYRADANDVNEIAAATAYRQVQVTIPAQPFAYGLPEDVASFTITNDATAGTNRMMYTLPTIKGDVETPLLLAQTTGPGITVDQGSNLGYLSSYSVSGSTHAFLARDLTELTSNVDVGGTVTGGGSAYMAGNYKACSFASGASPFTRLNGTFTTALTPMPGTYRVLMRTVIPTSSALDAVHVYRLLVSTDGGTNFTTLPDVTQLVTYNLSTAQGFLIDFGLVQFPIGAPRGQVGLSAAATTTVAPNFQLQVSGFPAGGGLRFDELMLLPVETNYGYASTAIVDFPTYSATLTNNVIAYDGINDEMRTLYDASTTAPFAGLPVPAKDMKFIGGLPTVRPGFNNYLQFLYNANVVTGTTAFTGRYYPRYLYVRPATT